MADELMMMMMKMMMIRAAGDEDVDGLFCIQGPKPGRKSALRSRKQRAASPRRRPGTVGWVEGGGGGGGGRGGGGGGANRSHVVFQQGSAEDVSCSPPQRVSRDTLRHARLLVRSPAPPS